MEKNIFSIKNRTIGLLYVRIFTLFTFEKNFFFIFHLKSVEKKYFTKTFNVANSKK
jgi:hypothetical protein